MFSGFRPGAAAKRGSSRSLRLGQSRIGSDHDRVADKGQTSCMKLGDGWASNELEVQGSLVAASEVPMRLLGLECRRTERR